MKHLVSKILDNREKYLSDQQFMNVLSGIIGLTVGLAAVLIKNSVYFIQQLLKTESLASFQHYFYFIYPVIGILFALLFIRWFIKVKVEHGIPSVLYAISETKGHIKSHNMFSSIVTSALTVGFGGSVGLEGPTVATGAAYGSSIGRALRLNYKQIIILLGAACTGAMAAIFKAPVAGIVFALEVIMIDLTIGSVLPLLISSVIAVLTSYLFLGPDVLYHFKFTEAFQLNDLPEYILLGVVTGLVSVYFTKVYIFIQRSFKRLENVYIRLLLAGISLGGLIFFFPALYGEGYEVINEALSENADFIVSSSIFSSYANHFWVGILVLIAVILFKSFATSLTFAAGGVGGIFAPTLFMGALIGLTLSLILNHLGADVNISNFSLVAMGGTIAGVLQAPLTAIFLIAEISSGYQFLVPLMLVSVISYLTTRAFIHNSVYTYQLAQRGQLMTHHADKNTLKRIDIDKIIEKDFIVVSPDDYLRQLVEVISQSDRAVFPVVDKKGKFVGVIHFTDVRKIIFKEKLYDKIQISELVQYPEFTIKPDDDMEETAKNLSRHHVYLMPVTENGKYIGFISRANFFAEYRKLLKELSDD